MRRRDKDPLQSTMVADTPTPGPSSQGHPQALPTTAHGPTSGAEGSVWVLWPGPCCSFHTQFFPNSTLNVQTSPPTQGISCPPGWPFLQTPAPTTAPHPICSSLCGRSLRPEQLSWGCGPLCHSRPVSALLVGSHGCHSPVLPSRLC